MCCWTCSGQRPTCRRPPWRATAAKRRLPHTATLRPGSPSDQTRSPSCVTATLVCVLPAQPNESNCFRFVEWRTIGVQVNSGQMQWTTVPTELVDRAGWLAALRNRSNLRGRLTWMEGCMLGGQHARGFFPGHQCPRYFIVANCSIPCLHARPLASTRLNVLLGWHDVMRRKQTMGLEGS